MSESKRKDLSLKDKIDILERFDKLPKMSQRRAAVQLEISQPLLCKILKNRDSIKASVQQNSNMNCKRYRNGKEPEVEKALKEWFENVREKYAPVNSVIIRQKAEQLAQELGKTDFTASEGWFHRWKKRENLQLKMARVEEQDAAKLWVGNELPSVTAKFLLDDIFSAEETGLYFRALPEHVYLFQNELPVAKDKLTILCCASMSGEKQRLVVVGNCEKPRCLENVESLPVDYYANRNAWMTSAIFNEWLAKWDNQLNKKICLLIDNCSAHLVTTSLKNIEITFLPDNTSNQGIIRNLKTYYRREMLTRIIDADESSLNAKKTSLLDAIHMLSLSWANVSKDTVKNSFEQSFLNVEPVEHKVDAPSGMTEQDFEDWLNIDENAQTVEQLEESSSNNIATTFVGIKEEVKEEYDDEGEEEYTDNPPTNKEMRQALSVLRRGVQYCADNFSLHYQYERFINELLMKTQGQASAERMV